MTLRLRASTRTAMAAAIETDAGTSPKLELRTGAPPTNLTDADTGTLLATINLPSDWASQASGVLTVLGVPISATAGAGGTVGHARFKTSANAVVADGTVTATGGGGDWTIDNVVLANGQTVNLTGWTMTMPNA